MILYHGSNVIVRKPVLLHKQLRSLDFGPGFYTTTNREQAIDFARKVMIRTETKTRFVSVYEFTDAPDPRELKVLRFEKPDEKWFDFVLLNRRKAYFGKKYDIVIGPVANDDIFTTLQLFENGILSRTQAVDALKVKKLYNQYSFATERSIAMLKFDHDFNAGEVE
ncbi:MAG: DUF3990 domain-containing protein [Synergistaceae bacterium]|jgi:hypothetical protein|nr:DUF3990 domain-containing protein [Synergistaceae bacterium]